MNPKARLGPEKPVGCAELSGESQTVALALGPSMQRERQTGIAELDHGKLDRGPHAGARPIAAKGVSREQARTQDLEPPFEAGARTESVADEHANRAGVLL